MPELPEVETIRLGLEKYLIGHRIEKLEIRLPKLVTGSVNDILGAKVIAVRRFGKGLVIDLSNHYSIAIHIKLTGQLIYQDQDVHPPVSLEKVKTVPNAWTHIIIYLDNNARLYYNDQRQFGWFKIVKTDELKNLSFFKEMGPEPFNGLTLDLFTTIIKKTNISIKVCIMDQKRIGGIGNIYANDALFLSHIDPRRKAKELTDREVKSLYKAILQVLKKGLDLGGASELNYVNVLGQDGGYQHHFLVYGQEGKFCPNKCGGVIKKMKLGGRGTYFCPLCQK